MEEQVCWPVCLVLPAVVAVPPSHTPPRKRCPEEQPITTKTTQLHVDIGLGQILRTEREEDSDVVWYKHVHLRKELGLVCTQHCSGVSCEVMGTQGMKLANPMRR